MKCKTLSNYREKNLEKLDTLYQNHQICWKDEKQNFSVTIQQLSEKVDDLEQENKYLKGSKLNLEERLMNKYEEIKSIKRYLTS